MKCVVCYEDCDRGVGPSGRNRGQTTAKIILQLFEQQISVIPPQTKSNKCNFNSCPKCFTDLTKIDRIFEGIEALLGQLAKARDQIGATIVNSFSRARARCQSQNVNLDLDNLMISTNSIREEIFKALNPDIIDAKVKKEIVDDDDIDGPAPSVDDIIDHDYDQFEDNLNLNNIGEIPEVEVSSFNDYLSPAFSTSSISKKEAEDKIASKIEVDQLKSEETDHLKSNQNEEQDIDDDDDYKDEDYEAESPKKRSNKKPISYERKKQVVEASLKHPNYRIQTLQKRFGLKSLKSTQIKSWKKLVEKTESDLAQNNSNQVDNGGRFFDPFIETPVTTILPSPSKRKRNYDDEKPKEVLEIDYDFFKKECLQNESILTLSPVPYGDVLNSTSINENVIKKYIQHDAQQLRENRIFKRKRNRLKFNLIYVKKIQGKSCPYCPYSAPYQYYIKKHILNIHPEKDEAKISYKICTVCQPPKKFSNESQFDLHNRKFHSDTPYFEPTPRIIQSDDNVKKFLCVLCNKNLTSLCSFRSHCRAIHNRITKTCTHCNKSFPKHRLSMHIASNHPTESEKNSSCPTCSKVFASLWRLKKHQQAVHKLKLLCRFCEKTFANQANLKDHELRHEGKFDFVCELCSKPFISMNGIRSHMKIVHGEKKPCPYCAKSINEHNLEFHIKQFHEKIFNFYCHVCSSGFFRVRELNMHLKKHSKETAEKQNTPSIV